MKHENYHIRDSEKYERSIIYGIAILSLFVVVELWGFYVSNSIALLSDAGHLLTDILGLCIAMFGFWIGKQKPNETYSYGYMRAEVIAAFINAVLWFVLFAGLIYESVKRIVHVQEVDPIPMFFVAVTGLIANLIVFKILHSNHNHENINMRGAILHVLLDILGSVAAVIGSIIIYFTGWLYADPIISSILAALILRSGVTLIKDCIRIFMEAKPDSIDVGKIKASILAHIEDVKDVHHVHVWCLSSNQYAITLHITLIDEGNCNSTIWNAKKLLKDQFDIIHSTIQVEHNECPDEELFYDV
jgi:cobalt-zinc-cadmium efflux system protein